MSPSPSTPARLTHPGAAKLPRTLLLVVGLIYIFSGLLFRDPWKTDDVVGLATMLTALNNSGGIALLLPQVGSLAYAENGPLVTWIGVLCISLFSPVFALFTSDINATILASRVPNLMWFGMLTYCIWYGTFKLARLPEAQPLPLPFGGEPSATDYGRMLADAALLFIIATVGIIWRMHESSEVPAIIAFQSLAFYALTRLPAKPASSSVILGLAIGCALLTRGWVGALPIILGSLGVLGAKSNYRDEIKWFAMAAIIAAAVFLFWWLPAKRFSLFWTQTWVIWNLSSYTWPNIATTAKALRDVLWFVWPTWPLALIALWNWRQWLRSPHMLVPTALLAAAILSLALHPSPFEPEFALLAVPSAVLAAFALPTLRRGVINTLDWFAVMCFSLTAATVWLGWIAQQTGWPPKISHSIARQTSGYEVFISIPALSIAALGTLSWILLVIWRTRRHPPGLWRGTVLSAGGLLTTWLLLVTLWLPALDYARSYRGVSNELQNALAEHRQARECVRGSGVGIGQRASFYVFNNIDLIFDYRCSLILQQLNVKQVNEGLAPLPDQAVELWSGRRGGDRHEMFRLIRIAPNQSNP
ncbi:glycosyltransferase [Paenalcaligenes niemegkensis]|uniref:ArnT family glycosyltransferase n=1 Tax=Paenalcaligenes niemegkensis TaxID=2895469 RepID=UPI001EE88498|nr:glycosyltransferase [Paenalcaligenes niemegkensis]MCQ9616844.1 glycosyltransferase [Paenalcaligenes niemegkensis]